MEIAVKDWECAREHLVIWSRAAVCESERRNKEIAPVWAPILERGVLAVKKDVCGPSLPKESWDLPNFKKKLGLDLMALMKERQQQKWPVESELKATEAASAEKGVLPSVSKTFIVELDYEDVVKSGLDAVEGWRILQAAADFEVAFQAACATLKKWLSTRRHSKNNVPKARDLGPLGLVISTINCLTLCRELKKQILSCMLPALQKKLYVQNVYWRWAHFSVRGWFKRRGLRNWRSVWERTVSAENEHCGEDAHRGNLRCQGKAYRADCVVISARDWDGRWGRKKHGNRGRF